MQSLMGELRSDVRELAGQKVVQKKDYADGIEGLPKSDVLQFFLEGGNMLIVRPSGIEPKLKVYLSVNSETKKEAYEKEKQLVKELENYINM